MQKNLHNILICPQCRGKLNFTSDNTECAVCQYKASIKDDKVFFVEPPDDVELNEKTDQYETWSTWRKENYHFIEHHLDAVPSDGLVIDIGAGPSQFRNLLKPYKVVGVDFYPYELVDVITDLTQFFPFRDESADVLLLSNVLEHLPDTNAVLHECYRLLKKEGCILATIPFLMRIHQAPYDYNRYTFYQLEKMLKEAGFRVIEIVPLARPFDVYSTMIRHYFNYALDAEHTQFKTMHTVGHLVLKVLWNLHKLSFKMIKSIFNTVPPTPDYTIGYGIFAKK